jgi:hypothetical protein
MHAYTCMADVQTPIPIQTKIYVYIFHISIILCRQNHAWPLATHAKLYLKYTHMYIHFTLVFLYCPQRDQNCLPQTGIGYCDC